VRRFNYHTFRTQGHHTNLGHDSFATMALNEMDPQQRLLAFMLGLIMIFFMWVLETSPTDRPGND
jgi:hypothetical protein